MIITKGQGEKSVVARRDGQPFSDDLERQEDEIAAYVEAGMAGSQPFDRPMQYIIVKAERQVKEREVVRVAEAIGKVTDSPTLHYAVLDYAVRTPEAGGCRLHAASHPASGSVARKVDKNEELHGRNAGEKGQESLPRGPPGQKRASSNTSKEKKRR